MNEQNREITFLCLDDDDVNRNEISSCIKELGFRGEIHEFDNGHKALDFLVNTTSKIDVIITDMVMPAITGLEFTKRLRELERYKTTPLIVLTSISTKEVVLDCVIAGADNYIVKPVTANILSKKLLSIWHK